MKKVEISGLDGRRLSRAGEVMTTNSSLLHKLVQNARMALPIHLRIVCLYDITDENNN